MESDARYASYRASLSVSSDAFIVGAFIEIRSSITRRIRRESRFVGEHTSLAKCGQKSKIERTEHIAPRSTYIYVRAYNPTRSFVRSFARVHANSTHGLRGDSWFFFAGLYPAALFKFVACCIRFRLSLYLSFSLSCLWQVLSQTRTFPEVHVYVVRASKQIGYLRIFAENDTHAAGSCYVSFSLSFFLFFCRPANGDTKNKKELKTKLSEYDKQGRITSFRIMHCVRYRKCSLILV